MQFKKTLKKNTSNEQGAEINLGASVFPNPNHLRSNLLNDCDIKKTFDI